MAYKNDQIVFDRKYFTIRIVVEGKLDNTSVQTLTSQIQMSRELNRRNFKNAKS